MKAVIMAGGEGSRLRPLTCGRPKPMVPVVNRPIMEHIVDLLVKHGFTEVVATLQYMPESIRDHFGNGASFGINMRYSVEETPLGTAGSVKNTADFLDRTFLVISGDALTDLDLSAAVAFHRQRGAMATLVLTRVSCPLEYGVVITRPDGSITQFLEKPAWGEVFSDTVNTGIYVLEPEVLDYIEPGRMFDFSKDLFPLLLREKKPLFGVVLPGYWCDIGNLEQYRQAHHDILSGKVSVGVPAEEKEPGLWLGRDVEIAAGVRIRGPVLIGDHCRLDEGVELDPYTVLGAGCRLRERASVKRSILWDNVYLGVGTSLRGAVLAGRVQVRPGAAVYEGAVVGSDSILKERSVVKPDVKLWPHKMVEAGTVLSNSLIWGTCAPKKIFGLEGVSGLINVDITPEYACRLGAAFASALGGGKSALAVSADCHPASAMLKYALVGGMQCTGARVCDLGTGITPMQRFAIRSLDLSGGVHVRISPRGGDQTTMLFFSARGRNIPRSLERKVENLLAREDFRRAEPVRLRPLEYVPDMPGAYLRALLRGLDAGLIRERRFSLVMAYDQTNLGPFVEPLCVNLNITLENVARDLSPSSGWQGYLDLLPRVARRVKEKGASAGVVLDPGGDRLVLVDEQGRVIKDNLLTALMALIILRSQGGPVVVPVTAPRVIETLAGRYRGRVVRTKTAVQDFVDKVLGQDEAMEQRGENRVSQFLLNFDAPGALTRVLEFAAGQRLSLGELVNEIPAFFVDQREVAVPWEAKGTVIRRLIEEPPAQELELLDGVKVYHPQGWALVLPDPEEPVCRVFSEGASMEIAQSLTDFYIERINRIAGGS